jgi:Right handed beta helix region
LILALLIALPIPSTGTFRLPRGVTEVPAEIRLPDGAHDLTIVGDGSTLRAAAKFRGRAILSCHGCRNIEFRNFAIDGNRDAVGKLLPLPPTGQTFANFFPDNGILIEDTDGFSVDHLDFTHIVSFAILVNHSRDILLDHISVRDSGSLNAKGRNNTTGGILLEEGTDQFTVADSVFSNIRGNGVWTHSRYMSPRNSRGKIAKNTFVDIGRDAIQVGHATQVVVTGNSGSRIGFPANLVDVENGGTPVGIDTSGNVDQSSYEYNNFEEIDGKCIDLDGFHDGPVRGNTCINRRPPEEYPYGNFAISINNASIEMQSRNILIEGNQFSGMKFGAIFALGEGHIIRNNRMTHLNTAHCNETAAKFGCLTLAGEPGFLESGIYLAKGGERLAPARKITIENNVITGYKMAGHCIEAAPSVKLSDNTIRKNTCKDE